MAQYYDGYDWDVDGFPGEYVYGDSGYMDDYYLDERWKPICCAPGYWISNKARIWSTVSESFIWGTPLRSGHIDVSLQINGRRAHKYLHRLVAEAFIPNPNNCPVVRHLDDDPSNNEVCNLEWGDQYDNVQDCIHSGHFRYFTHEDIERANEARRTPIIAVHLGNGRMKRYMSQREASTDLGIDQSCICAVVNGRCRSASGYYFMKDHGQAKAFDWRNRFYQRRGLRIRAVNPFINESRTYDSPRKAAYDLNVSESSVSNVLHGKQKSAKGWFFERLDEGDVCDD